MNYLDALYSQKQLVSELGEGNAHMVWALALYLEEPDVGSLASEALTDGPDDKKIDFIYLDRDGRRIVFAQGYFSKNQKDSAPANKASDLNTACAWLLSGDIEKVPDSMRPLISDCRAALAQGEIDTVELLYVHNLPESINVTKELQTAAAHFKKALGEPPSATVLAREFGASQIEHLFSTQDSKIEVKDEIFCPAKVQFQETGPKWQASVLSVPGIWLHEIYAKYGDPLFSANYRGFLGISRRRRINTGIRQSAEKQSKDFWVFNNGITLLTLGVKEQKEGTKLIGISIINGAQTTGSVGSVDLKTHDLNDVRVLCRVIQSNDPETINDIVKFNNTQNEITTWDQYSNDVEQNRLEEEFFQLGHVYSKKRGFRAKGDQLGIDEVAQPLLAFHGRYQDAVRGKNLIFDRKPLYANAFESKKARHVLFVYALARAIDERRLALKIKSSAGKIISLEEEQLKLLRNLRFKSFLIAVIARSLEPILARKVDLFTIAFTATASNSKNNSLVGLAAAWAPIVEAALTYVATKVNPADFPTRFFEEGFVEEAAKHVSALLYAGKAGEQFKAFADLVAES